MRMMLLALLVLLTAAPAAAPPAVDRLLGVWDGTMSMAQVGKCSMSGGPQEVRLVVNRSAEGKLQAGLTPLPAVVDRDDGLKVSVSDKGVRFEQPATAMCGENFTRKYTVKLEGAWPVEADGKRTLHLEGLDAPCIMSGCRFVRVLDLEWKREPPAPAK